MKGRMYIRINIDAGSDVNFFLFFLSVYLIKNKERRTDKTNKQLRYLA